MEMQRDIDRIEKHYPTKTFVAIMSAVIVMIVLAIFFRDHTIRVIAGQSMEPVIHQYDTIIVDTSVDISDIEEDDIILYNSGGIEIAHRVVYRQLDSDGVSLVTKGDNNPIVDDEPVTSEQYIGKVVKLLRTYKILPYFV